MKPASWNLWVDGGFLVLLLAKQGAASWRDGGDPWRRMHRSRAPSIAPGTFFVAQSWAGCITNMPGFNLRQAQPKSQAFIDAT
jgi:hypothetical protein